MKLIIRGLIFFFVLFFGNNVYSQTWNMLGNGTAAEIYCFHKYNGKLVLGSNQSIGGISHGVATWDGNSWDSLGCGTSYGRVSCIATYNNEVIVAGNFFKMGTNLSNSVPNTRTIAAWNGTQWHSLGSGGDVNNFPVNALAVYNGELYAGGDFIDMGGISCNRIAKWNGSNWSAVGTGLTGAMPEVYSMCVYDGELYVGGDFQIAGGVTANGIARWNGTQWDSVGPGIYGWPFSMIVDSIHNNLIIGGNFSCPDTTLGVGICAWNGTNFLSIGHGLLGMPRALSFYNNYLFATRPSNTGAVTDTVLVYWDSISWKPVLGPNNDLGALAEYNNELYVGGFFTKIDSLNIPWVARYSHPSLNIPEPESTKNNFNIFPNPFTDHLTLEFDKNENYEICFYDITARKILKQHFKKSISINTNSFSPGIYFYDVRGKDGRRRQGKVVKE